MLTKRSFLFCLVGMMVMLNGTSLWAEDWTTLDGKVYHDVSVVKVEPDAVTILHHDGGALVSMTNLPPDLQKRFNYDPVSAKEAADARAKIQAELAQAEQMAEQALASRNARDADSETSETESASETAPDGNHYTMDDFVEAASTLRPDRSNGDHFSINALAASMSTLRPDRSSGTHYSMDSFDTSL